MPDNQQQLAAETSVNLLWITTSFPRWPGDWQGHFIAAAGCALAKMGHSVRILCPHGCGLAECEEWQDLRIQRFRYAPEKWESLAYGAGIPDNLRQRPWLYLLVPSFLRAMKRTIATEASKSDLIHAHWAVCGAMAAAVCCHRRAPLAVSLRGSDTRGQSMWSKHWLRQSCRAADAVICLHDAMRCLAEESGALAQRVYVLTNGVDLAAIDTLPCRAEARHRLGLPPDAIVVISVGRLIPLKRHEYLLRAFSQAAVSLTLFPHLVILGEGPERMRLASLAADLGIAGQTHFPGSVPPKEVWLWLKASDIFALASEREGRSNALAEAMAAGLACLVTPGAEGGLLSSASEDCGLIAELAEWPSALRRLLADSVLRQALGVAARRRAETAVGSWEKHAEALEKIYQYCLEEREKRKNE